MEYCNDPNYFEERIENVSSDSFHQLNVCLRSGL